MEGRQSKREVATATERLGETHARVLLPDAILPPAYFNYVHTQTSGEAEREKETNPLSILPHYAN